MIEQQTSQQSNTPEHKTNCPVCFDVRFRASDVLSSHINDALVALHAQNLTTDEKVKRVMAILGRAQSTSDACHSRSCDQVRRIKPAPDVLGNADLIPMAVFQINDIADGKSEVAQVFQYVPAGPVYFKRQKPDMFGRPVFKQV